MQKSTVSCIRRVGGAAICKYCEGKLLKHGKASSGKCRYKCCLCRKTQVEHYTYCAYETNVDSKIIQFIKEGLGIRSTARILNISTTTLLKRIVNIANNIPRPIINKGKIYEVDEVRSYIKRKDRLVWIVYALERTSGRVTNFAVGSRTNTTLYSVIRAIELSEPEKIYTDKLRQYRYLVPEHLHITKRYGTNHIERMNLTLRTHLKRLNRRTICFSKSEAVLVALLKIYFWGDGKQGLETG